MNRTTWGWILIGLGATDLLGWVGIGYGWTNMFFGNNLATQCGPALLISIGVLLLRLGHAEQKAIADEELEDKHLPADEKVIHRQLGTYSVLTLTNRNLRFHGHSLDTSHPNSVRKLWKNIPKSDSMAWPLSDITAVRVALMGDATDTSYNGNAYAFFNFFSMLGVRLTLKDGTAVNVPCGSPQLMEKYIHRNLPSSPMDVSVGLLKSTSAITTPVGNESSQETQRKPTEPASGEARHQPEVPTTAPSTNGTTTAVLSSSLTPSDKTSSPTTELVGEGFLVRAKAFGIDVLVMLIPVTIASVMLTWLLSAMFGSTSEVVERADMAIPQALWVTYFAMCHSSPWQATLGKRFLGLNVVDDNGGRITHQRAIGRYAGFALTLGLGALAVLFTKRKQAVHDLLAHTLVIKADDNGRNSTK